ncbi:MAG TPA: F0F1 ATP synthase subunit alpha, partial [Gemmatimonadota bacterium]|nr:F0F1 ATP synthase subunit alpha [Gemmatimonadota bacterium]
MPLHGESRRDADAQDPGPLGRDPGPTLHALRRLFDAARRARAEDFGMQLAEVGTVTSVERSTVRLHGLSGTGYEEVLSFAGGATGVAMDLGEDDIGVVLLEGAGLVEAGSEVRRTGRVVSAPTGDALLARVVDPTGRPLDGRGPLGATTRVPAEKEAPPLLHRAQVRRPLHTGFKVVDALIPVGRGQRELILGDRQTGKTTLAIETIVNQRDQDVVCVYCAIGQRDAAVNRVIERLRSSGALEHTVVVVAGGDDPPGLQYVAPFAATSMAEHFVERGRDALVVYDDLGRHARA